MAKWHTVKAGRFDDNQDDSDFLEQGPLVSIGREPPQNSTDNPLPGNDSPVVLRYSMRTVPLYSESQDKYLPQNPWGDHITCPQNESIMTYGSSLQDKFGSSVKVLLVEDYNATGLVGDPNMLFPRTVDSEGNFDRASLKNTFFWFMRSTGANRPTIGRGGSWGLGKLAFPLASSVRTFFVVTSRLEGDRYLAGQAVLKPHQFGIWWDSMMYFAEDDLIDHGNPHSWAPISDSDEIDSFCSTFQVDRPAEKPGMSVVILLPKDDLNIGHLALCLISNYCVPIMEGKLKIELSQSEDHLQVIDSSNIKAILSGDVLPWRELSRNLPGSAGVNPAWTTKGRMDELVLLYESLQGRGIGNVELPIGTPSPNSAPNSNEQFESILPERGTPDLEAARDAFQRNEVIYVRGEIPVHHRVNGTELGSYELVLRKCDEGSDDAEAHFYRDQISLPLVLDKKPASEGVSSLLIVQGDDNPFTELLRQAEGPAHLYWNERSTRMSAQFKFGPTAIRFLKELVRKIVNRITSVQTESESIWDDIFSLGGEKPPPPPIEREFRIVEHDSGGCTITPLEEDSDLTGNTYLVRIGYPKPAGLNPKKPPDVRAIDVHDMTWNCHGATLSKDVKAQDGGICRDRVFVTINDADFEIQLLGLDTELKAQAIVTERSAA